MPEEDERIGPYEKQHSDEDILEFVGSQHVVTTKEVADHFEYTTQTARRRLKELELKGKVNRKDVGNRFVRWSSK